ncbi:MAG: PEP-CTERM sorting domain-containing protein [Betaproteobacteria bacterium]|nr:PEP-CTERM sorting domain-containing protein [Betaproteobacteria bacterium]
MNWSRMITTRWSITVKTRKITETGTTTLALLLVRHTRLLAAAGILAAVGLGTAPRAHALPTGFGTGCTYSGHTLAEGGSPGSLSLNEDAFSFSTCGGDVATSDGQVDVIVNAETTNVHSFYQSALTTSSASAGFGSLHAFSNSRATSSPEQYIYLQPNGDPATTDNLYRAIGNSAASAYWYDTITIGGAPNASGFVVLQFTLDLSGMSSVVPENAGGASFQSDLYIDDDRRPDIYHILSTSQPGVLSTTIGFRPGWQVQMYGSLSVSTNIAAGRLYRTVCYGGFICQTVSDGYVSEAESIANASNTAGFYIDVLTPGGTISSLSGATYLAPVPEPSTTWLLTGGLVGVVAFARRARVRKG